MHERGEGKGRKGKTPIPAFSWAAVAMRMLQGSMGNRTGSGAHLRRLESETDQAAPRHASNQAAPVGGNSNSRVGQGQGRGCVCERGGVCRQRVVGGDRWWGLAPWVWV